MVKLYVPERGDIIWLEFEPQTGREQKGKRPAIVLSHRIYNEKVGLGLFCRITSQEKGYPFEVKLPTRLKTKGVILADQVKSFDWKSRNASFIEKSDVHTLAQVISSVDKLIN